MGAAWGGAAANQTRWGVACVARKKEGEHSPTTAALWDEPHPADVAGAMIIGVQLPRRSLNVGPHRTQGEAKQTSNNEPTLRAKFSPHAVCCARSPLNPAQGCAHAFLLQTIPNGAVAHTLPPLNDAAHTPGSERGLRLFGSKIGGVSVILSPPPALFQSSSVNPPLALEAILNANFSYGQL